MALPGMTVSITRDICVCSSRSVRAAFVVAIGFCLATPRRPPVALTFR